MIFSGRAVRDSIILLALRIALRHAKPLFRIFVAPGPSCPTDAAEEPTLRDSSSFQPFVNHFLNPGRHWHGPNVSSFSDQVDDGPMIFATLEMLDSQFS